MKIINAKARLVLILVALFPLLFAQEFYIHFFDHFTGSVTAITQQWHIAVLNIVLFLAFLIPLSFRRKVNWGEYGLVGAFFVSLFIEMYGIPFSIIFASKYFFPETVHIPLNTTGFTFLGVDFAVTIGMVYGGLLMIVGMLLIILGWITLYKNSKRKELVTTGLYAHSRHPQYLGFILITVGWFIAWPTLLTLVFAPILSYKYFKLCRQEEKEIHSKEYAEYKKNVPLLI